MPGIGGSARTSASASIYGAPMSPKGAGVPRPLHGEAHRGHVGVEARADVLDVEDEGVEAGELLRLRLARLAVEAVDRQAADRIARVADLLVRHAADAVLGAEERDERHPRRA